MMIDYICNFTEAEMNEILINLLKQPITLSDASRIDQSDLDDIFSLGCKRLIQKNYGQAITVFRYLCVLNPFEAKYYEAYASSLFADGNLTVALNRYQMALLFDPRNIDIIYSLGLLYIAMGNYNSAKIKFESVITKGINLNSHTDLVKKSHSYLAQIKQYKY